MQANFLLSGLALLVVGWIFLRYGDNFRSRGLHWIKWSKIIGITPFFLMTLSFFLMAMVRISGGDKYWLELSVLLAGSILVDILVWKRPLEGGLGVLLAVLGIELLIPASTNGTMVSGISLYAGIFLLASGYFGRHTVWVKGVRKSTCFAEVHQLD